MQVSNFKNSVDDRPSTPVVSDERKSSSPNEVLEDLIDKKHFERLGLLVKPNINQKIILIKPVS